MDTSRKICIILTPSDLSAENIKATVKTIEHNPNKFYLLQSGWQTNLWEIVEQMGKVSEDENTLTKMRVAYDLKFDLQTVLKTGSDLSADGTEVKRLADLLEIMDFDDNLNLNRADYHVIINDDGIVSDEGNNEAGRAVAKLFQQTVFLNIVGLDIQKKSEIKKALIKNRFREKYPTLRQEIFDNKAFIESKLSDGTKLSTESRERAQKIINAFNFMLAEFDKAKTRPIRIAAMGTKKAGKSVVINSLLKRDYAPTSSTLPTPNTIKYIPADPNEPLTLEYGSKTYTFADAAAISDFIGAEFKKAQKITGEGAGLPDMIIHYPSDELTGYEVWDTPGPNVAFTDEHRKNAEACIREVDVCIFVMNYSNHLTNDEVTFLKNIHSFFKENNKFYSLFITVNRIDERYAVDEGKSVDRILDYISSRLAALKYENVVIFGTSALQSFYLDNVIDLIKTDRKEDDEDVDELPLIDEDSLRPLKKRHKNALTPIKFISDALGNLEYFHGIENATEKELYALSGVPQLWSYTQYIGGSKADVEIVDSVVGKFDTAFDEVKNSLIVADLLQLTDADKKYLIELGELIAGLRVEVDKAIDAVRPLMGEGKIYRAMESVSENVRANRRQAQSDAVTRSKHILNESGLTSNDVELMARGRQSDKILGLNRKIVHMVFAINKHSADVLNDTKDKLCTTYILDVEKAIQTAQETITQETDKVRATVTNATAKSIMESFKTPTFPPAIDRLMAEFERIDAGVDNELLNGAAKGSHRVEYEQKTRTEYQTVQVQRKGTRKREARGVWENIRGFFGKDYYEDYTYFDTEKMPYEVSYVVSHDVYDVEAFKREIARELQSRISSAVENAHDKIDSAVKDEIKKIFSNVQAQCDQIGDSYKRLYSDFERDIKMATDSTDKHRRALERDIETFNAIKAKLQKFVGMWNEILHGDAKE